MPTTVIRRDPPWTAGLRAARANLLPGLMVQAVMLALLLAYSFYPTTHEWLDRLAALKARWGYGYSAIAAIFAGAVIPELIRILVIQKARIRRSNFNNLLFSIPFWCFMGLVVDFFYSLPSLLQIPLFALALSMWVMLYTWMSEHRSKATT